MNGDELTKFAGGFGIIVSALLGLLTWRENQRKGSRETTQQREDREAAEQSSNLAMNDSQLRYFIESLRSDREKDRAEMVRLAARIDSLETRLQAEQATSLELRADLATANGTIRDLTSQNQRQAEELTRLRSQIDELQGREKAEDRADARSERAQDRQDTRAARQDTRNNRHDEREDRRDQALLDAEQRTTEEHQGIDNRRDERERNRP